MIDVTKYFCFKGNELSSMKCFSSSSKRFINKAKDDLEIIIDGKGRIKVFYGESGGEFRLEEHDNKYHRHYGNLYKSEIITKIVNELIERGVCNG